MKRYRGVLIFLAIALLALAGAVWYYNRMLGYLCLGAAGFVTLIVFLLLIGVARKQQQLMDTVFADNDTIWEGVFSGERTYPYSAVCLTTTYCCFVRRSDVESAISDPTVALRVIHMLSDKLHDANERSRILSISEPVKRIAAFLIYREKRSNEPYITLRLDDIAGSVGLRPETVSRNIRKLVSEGLIEKVGQSGFRIPDFERLNSFVED